MAELDTSLTGFIANVKNGGLAKTTYYTVMISPPKAMLNDNREFNTDLNKYILFCDAAELPSSSIHSTDTSVYGEVRETPTQRAYGGLTLSFYVDIDLQIKLMFDSWMNLIIDPISRTHGYYDDYTSIVEIIVYDVNEVPKYAMQLHECYPKDIQAINLAYATDTSPMKLSVSMQYKYYRIFDYEGISLEEPVQEAIRQVASIILPTNAQQGLLNGVLYSTNPNVVRSRNPNDPIIIK